MTQEVTIYIDNLPSGSIIMWYGDVNKIPDGWALCDGSQDRTPDLRGKFMVGYDPNVPDYHTIGNLGGQKDVILTENEIPNHTHLLSKSGNHKHQYTDNYFKTDKNTWKGGGEASGGYVGNNECNNNCETGQNGEHDHIVTSYGNGRSYENRPPYFVIAYIMKL